MPQTVLTTGASSGIGKETAEAPPNPALWPT